MIEYAYFERRNRFMDYNQIEDIQTEDTPFSVPDKKSLYISFCDGKRIFRKSFSFRELLGEEIATFMGRDTIHYFLLFKENVFYLASFPFIEQKECYPDDFKELYLPNRQDFENDNEYGQNYIPFFLKQSKDQKMREKFLKELYQSFAIDTYMRQTDRCSCNTMLYQEKDNLFWTPMYDYGCSFGNFDSEEEVLKNFFYQNPFFSMKLQDYSKFLTLYPEFSIYLKQIQRLDLMKSIQNIKDKYCFSYSNRFLDYWKSQEEMSQKVIQKIMI